MSEARARGLGRGLSALLGEVDATPPVAVERPARKSAANAPAASPDHWLALPRWRHEPEGLAFEERYEGGKNCGEGPGNLATARQECIKNASRGDQ